MHRHLRQLLITLLCLAGCSPVPSPKKLPTHITSWAAYYNDTLPADMFAGLDLVVFDARYHPDIAPLQKTVVLGYVTMGEVYDDAPEKAELEAGNALLFHNARWNSHAVDLTAPRWRTLVMQKVDNVIDQGFDGVFIDTVDSPLSWAKTQNPKRYAAQKQAAIQLIHDIRLKYPKKKIMLNRGFDIAGQAAFDIDYLLAESILTHKDDFTGQFALVTPKAYQDAMEQLHTIVARAGKLQVLTLDYWDMGDTNGVERIYKKQRASGFTPYVTTPDLKQFNPWKPENQPSADGT